MIVFSVSDKGGTGRSVTSTNVAYRAALSGYNTCYLDFDFGSPTVGAIFDVEHAVTGVRVDGLHDYLAGRAPAARRIDVWTETNRDSFRRPPGAGSLTLLPGSHGGAEFYESFDARAKQAKLMVDRCVDLFVGLDEEFDLAVVDLSAGRSFALELVLQATARPALHPVLTRWLVFHKWTRQHVIAAHNLVHGERGLYKSAEAIGHTEHAMSSMIRFVRTAVISQDSTTVAQLRPSQQSWLAEVDRELEKMASQLRLGRALRIGSIPLDPVLQWREQLLTNWDVHTLEIANQETVTAFEDLARVVTDHTPWEGL
jgi:hypothetical protein